MRLVVTYLCVMFLGLGVFAQSKNIFLDRSFWKSNPSIETIDQKISEGNDITELNSNAFDAVVYALLEKVDNATVEYMLSKEGNGVNKITHDGRTYIFWAAYKSNIEMVQYLLDKGAKMDVVDSHGYTALNFAASTGQLNTDLFDLLLANGAKVTDVDHNGANVLLLTGPYLKDFSMIDYLISKGVDPAFKDNNGNGLFNYAARGGNQKFLQQLIDKGYSYKELNKHGGNAFMFATRGTRGAQIGLDTYMFLKNAGIEVNITGKDGRSPLHNLAYREKDLDIYEFFLIHGLSVNQQDADGNTPFLNASRNNSIEVVDYLSSKVANFNLKNEKGQSALSLAVSRNTTKICQFLLKKGADVNVIDSDGNSLAYYLVTSYSNEKGKSFDEKLNLLKGYGFQINADEAKGQTLYHLAVEKNNLELITKLEAFDLDINAKNDEGLTALHIAAMKAHNSDILEYLMSQGADKTILTEFDESVYDLAAENELLQNDKVDISFLKK